MLQRSVKPIFALFLFATLFTLLWAVAPLPKVHAMENDPVIPACTSSNFGTTISVPVPSEVNHEIWTCTAYFKVFSNSPNAQATTGWTLFTAVPNPSTWQNLNSSLYLDVSGPSLNDGALVHQWTFNNGLNQWWNMHSNTGVPVLNARSAYTNNKECLAVDQGSKTQGAKIFQWNCNGNADQDWMWVWNGFYRNGWPVWNIVNGNSFMCLGIGGASRQVGAQAVQWSCNGSTDQDWS